MLNATFCSIQNIGCDFSLAHYGGDKIPRNWYWCCNMSCLLRLPTPLQWNFKALFATRNRLRALNDAILLIAGRCHVGHKNANRLHARGSACTLVATTQDVALDRAATGIFNRYISSLTNTSLGVTSSSSSSIGTASLVGFGLLNYRWVFLAGRFLQSAVASGTSNPQPGGSVI